MFTEQPSTYMMTKISHDTVFDMRAYSGNHNGWDKSKLHPCSHKIRVLKADGTETIEIDVAQLELFLDYAGKCENMGAALDAVATKGIRR